MCYMLVFVQQEVKREKNSLAEAKPTLYRRTTADLTDALLAASDELNPR